MDRSDLTRVRCIRPSGSRARRRHPWIRGISFVAPQDEGLPPAFQHQPYSEATSETIDAEVRRIVEECHREAERLLAEHRAALEALAQALLQAESLDEHEIRKATGLDATPA